MAWSALPWWPCVARPAFESTLRRPGTWDGLAPHCRTATEGPGGGNARSISRLAPWLGLTAVVSGVLAGCWSESVASARQQWGHRPDTLGRLAGHRPEDVVDSEPVQPFQVARDLLRGTGERPALVQRARGTAPLTCTTTGPPGCPASRAAVRYA